MRDPKHRFTFRPDGSTVDTWDTGGTIPPMEETQAPATPPASAQYSDELMGAIQSGDIQLVHELITGLRPGRHISVVWGEGTTTPGAIKARRQRMARPAAGRRLWKLLRRAERTELDSAFLADTRIHDAIQAWLTEVA